MEEYVTDEGRKIARMTFWCRLTTADGAVRTIQWQGRPPRMIELPIRRTHAFSVSPDVPIPENLVLTRRYDQTGWEGQRTATYEEIVP